MTTLNASCVVHPLAAHLERHSPAFATDGNVPVVFLTQPDVRSLLAAPEAGSLALPLLGRLAAKPHAQAVQRVQLVADHVSFASLCSIERFDERVRSAVAAALGDTVEVNTVVLGHGIADTTTVHASGDNSQPLFDKVVSELVELIFELRRRDDSHFERAPLTLPAPQAGNVHLLTAQGIAAFLGTKPVTPRGGFQFLHAPALCSWRELVKATAEAASVPTCDAPHGVLPDALSDLMARAMRHATELHALGDVQIPDTAQAHALSDPGFDWRHRVSSIVAQHLQQHRTAQAPRFDGLPGLERKRCSDGTGYVRVGTHGPALLLVNAFGLSLDIWHDLVNTLAGRFTVLALDDTGNEGAISGLPDTYYDTADSVQRYTQAVRTVLAQEAMASCHVVSWCSGAKYAIELARAMPQAIASMCLFSPSFAGITGYAGSDSAYETNLHTMCKLVDRMPQAAQNMARSMMALMQKSESAAVVAGPAEAVSATLSLADKATLGWLQAPFSSAANMIQFSRQLMNFRAHQLGTGEHAGQALELPVMLVTGQMDNTTCSLRARDICIDLFPVLQFELRSASHYFIHQNSRLAAQLLQEFVGHALQADLPHPRLVRTAATARDSVVSGEI